MYQTLFVHDKPRTIETVDKLFIDISETKCIGVAGMPVAFEIRDYGDKKRAFVSGIVVSPAVEYEKSGKAMRLPITDSFFQKLTREKILEKYNSDDFVFLPGQYEPAR